VHFTKCGLLTSKIGNISEKGKEVIENISWPQDFLIMLKVLLRRVE